MTNYKELLKKITTFILDCDGVLTDGNILVTQDGDALRTINTRDGYILQYAVKKGYRVIILTGATSQSISHRFVALGIREVHQGIDDKSAFLQTYLDIHKLNKQVYNISQYCVYI